MTKKRWALLLFILLLLFGWYKLFYKTHTVKYIPQSADAIIAIDKKRIINTLIWQFITNPSQWKISSSSKKDSSISWKKVIDIPDYVTPFHITNQPNNVWHICLPIINSIKINYYLLQEGFTNLSGNEFINEDKTLLATIYNGILLISTANKANKLLHDAVVNELFTQNKFATKEVFENLMNTKSHAALYIAKNNFLQEDAIVKANFNKEEINISSVLQPQPFYTFTQSDFNFSTTSLFNLHFTQPSPQVFNLLDSATKSKINKALNLNADSLFLATNKSYHLQINKFINRVDSAITYTYDDDFNKIEKVVVNNVQEPVYNFTVTGSSVNNIYNNWQTNKLLEATPLGNLFTPIPFVKSYCTVIGNQLKIQPYNYKEPLTNTNFKGIGYLQLNIADIPANLLNYLPDDIRKAIGNLQSLVITAEQKDKAIDVKVVVSKKKNDLAMIKF
jgi:hypothetical protein